MNFNDKYNGDKNAAMRDGLLISKEIGLCACGKPTRYIDINYEGYVCSEECMNKLDTQNWEK
jgi:hypothetical protein